MSEDARETLPMMVAKLACVQEVAEFLRITPEEAAERVLQNVDVNAVLAAEAARFGGKPLVESSGKEWLRRKYQQAFDYVEAVRSAAKALAAEPHGSN